MQTWMVVAIIVVGIGFFGTWCDEVAKYNTAYHTCQERWTKNNRILSNDICSDSYERILHGEKAQEMCLRAERENYITPSQCARQVWWQTCLLNKIMNELAGSYWKVMPVFVILSITAMYFAFSLFKEKAKVREFFHMFQSLKEETIPALPPATSYRFKDRFKDCETIKEVGVY